MSAVATVRKSRKTASRRPRKRAEAKPFTLAHFRAWAAELILDNGEPWILEPFQEAYAADLFAGYPECWLVVPEGNGKTTLLAGLGLYGCEFAPAASIPVAASSREQAEVMFRQAEGFVLRSPRLRSIFKCQEGYRRIKNMLTGGRIQVFAADDRTGDGIIPFPYALLEELHRQRDLRLYRTWRGKIGKRGGQIAAISTAGEPGEEFEETRERIRQTASESKRKGAFLRAVAGGVCLHEWAVPEGANVEDMKVVKAANPFSGITLETLREKRSSATMTLAHWCRFVCNLATRSALSAITEAEWHKARTSEEIPVGESVWAGLDVGWRHDTTALVPLWIPEWEHRLLGPAVILVPPRDGTSMSPDEIKAALLNLHDRNPIHTLVMDTSNANDLADWAATELDITVVDRGQSNSFQVNDYEKFMEALRQGWLKHTGCPGLARHVLNAIARMLPGGDARFDRPHTSRLGQRGQQDTRVIDALTAAAMVHATAAAELTAEPEPSFAWGPA